MVMKRMSMVCWYVNGLLGFPGGSDGEESTHSVKDLGLIPGLGRSPGGGDGHPLQYSCLENPREQRSLAGYSRWGSKESDTAAHLSTRTFYYNYTELSLLGPV